MISCQRSFEISFFLFKLQRFNNLLLFVKFGIIVISNIKLLGNEICSSYVFGFSMDCMKIL